nr:hypothetical protein [Tanacetum cinerariifolium]
YTSLTELEYHLEEVYKATTDQLDWVNPEGQQYPHNLLQPLPLIPDNRGCRVIPFEHFINNDLEYLRGGASSRKYTTSVTKTKAADYGHIKWIEDLVPRDMLIQQPIDYNKHAFWGVSHWGRKRKGELLRFSLYLYFDIIYFSRYPEIHPPSQEISDEVFQANNYVQYKENLENSSNPNQEKGEPPQDSDIHQLIEECSTEVSEEQKQSMENMMLELVKTCQEKEFLCIHYNVNDLIESALNTKLLSINSNSQRLEKKQQEVKNVVEQPAERRNRSIQSLQNFRVVYKNSISLNNTSQISSIHAIAPILSTKEPEHSLSMGYEHLSITLETESDEVTESNDKNLLPIPSECEVTLEDESKRDVPISENSPICDNHSNTFSDSKIDDDISVYDDDFKDIEYVEALLSDLEIVNVEEENVVQQEEEKVDLEDISQIQDVVLREKLLSITRLISNIESLNDNPTPDHVLNSFESDNSLSNNFSPEFKTFCDHSEETRSGNTTHADNCLPEYDSFCFEIEPDQERLIDLVKNGISNDSSNDLLLEEADLFLASNNSIPPGIENVANDSEGDICFLEELLIDYESSDSNFEDNLSIPRPPPEPPDAEIDAGEEILVVMNDKDEDVDYSSFIFVKFAKVFSLLSAESDVI